jgi:isopenicillin-N N-acyltransferase-like protein
MQHIELSGPPFEMGEQHGRRLAGLIAEEIEHYAGVWGRPGPEQMAGAAEIEAALLARCPHLVEELRGIAAGAGLPYEQILWLNVGYDAPAAGAPMPCCTAIGLPGTLDGPLVAKTDDVPFDERQYETFVRARPRQGHSFMCYCFAGWAANQGGINDAGLALAMTGLPAAGPRNSAGIPSLLFLRLVLERCATLDEALALAEEVPLRGAACSMTLADAQSDEVVVVENYPALRAVRRSRLEPTVRANHPLCPETQALQSAGAPARIPGLAVNSRQRVENASRRLRQLPRSLAGLQALLGDHSEPGAVCQHGQAGLHTSIAMIMIPRRRAMLAAEGYGCEPYVEYTL